MAVQRKRLHNAAVLTADGTVLSTRDVGHITLQIKTTGFSGTINFEGKLDAAADFAAVSGLPALGMTTWAETLTLTTNTAVVIYHIPLRGLEQFRARITRSAGSVTIDAVATNTGF